MDLAGKLASFNNYRQAAFLVAGLLIGGTVIFLFLNAGQVSKQKVGNELVSTLEDQSGQTLELVAVNEENGLYKVDMTNSQDQLITYYTTKNGKVFTSSVTEISDLQQFIAARNGFSSCLSDKQVVLYGNASQRATQIQIQTLGGAQTVQDIYSDINDQDVLRQALQRGVQRVPAVYYNNETLQGVNQLNQIESFTGCSFSTTQ